MYLKNLTLQGFKSFADRTRFNLSGGITAIVGPNGCGKSNIVDALKWILGGQSPKELRGQAMKDIIFTGTQHRQPVSFAEAVVVFDNSTGLLPCELSEVSISRRLFRSGESEYRINGEKCRLRDIKDLFADTGIGTESYSILEQGKIDLLLQSSPRERRIVFEEAAGISRFRTRREEASRQLSRTEDNLARLGDIIAEIESRIRSVRIQAGRARRYREIEKELRSCRLRLAWRDLMRLYAERCEWSFRKFFVDYEISKHQEKLKQLQEESAFWCGKCESGKENLRSLENQRDNARSKQQTLRERREITEKRISELQAAKERRNKEAQEARQNIDKYESELQELSAHYTEAVQEERSLAERKERAESRLEEAGKRLNQAKEQAASERQKLVELMETVTSLRNRRSETAGEENLAEARLERLSDEQNQVERNTALSALEELRARNRLAAVLFEKKRLEKAKEEARAQADRQMRNVEEKERECAETTAQIRELSSRRELLCRLLSDLEGVGESARKVIHAAREGRLSRVRGLLAELITTSPSHARAIENALGVWGQAIVVENEDDLKDVLSFLGSEAGFCAVILDQVKGDIAKDGLVTRTVSPSRPGDTNSAGRHTQVPQRGLHSAEEAQADLPEGQPGPGIPASDLVECPPDLAKVVRAILKRTFIVENENRTQPEAGRLTECRTVALSGAVREPWGGIRFGTTAGVLTRRTEIAECEERIKELQKDREVLSQTVTEQKAFLNRLREELSSLSQKQTALHGRTQALGELLRQLGKRKADLLLQRDVVYSEKTGCEGELNRLREERSRLEADLKQQETKRASQEKLVSEREAGAHSAALDQKARHGELSELRVQETAARENTRRLEESRDRLKDMIEERNRYLHETEEESAQTARHIREANQELETLGNGIEKERRLQNDLENKISEAEGQLKQYKSKADGLDSSTKELSETLKEQQNELSDINLEEREVAVKLENIREGIKEEYEIDVAAVARGEAVSEELNAANVTAPEDNLREKVAELKRKFERHGNVNLAAINELKELEDRYSYLSSQRDDLVQAKTRLRNVITELNRKSRKRFNETFHTVNEAFGELFRKAFGGGKAELVLEEGEDILTAGIEVFARPPGRKLSSVRMLSGGERTLTTLVLLFAILRVKPSPFCVLDEVDATLDEANIRRFLLLIDEFTTSVQFLVITHNKLTMLKSHSLLGVTMQEKGVSKTIGVDLQEIEEGAQKQSVSG